MAPVMGRTNILKAESGGGASDCFGSSLWANQQSHPLRPLPIVSLTPVLLTYHILQFTFQLLFKYTIHKITSFSSEIHEKRKIPNLFFLTMAHKFPHHRNPVYLSRLFYSALLIIHNTL